jgi:hypothetical protein
MAFPAQKIFSGEIKNHLLMFLSKKSDAYAGQFEIATSIAKVRFYLHTHTCKDKP